MAENRVEIRVTASGAEQVERVLKAISKEGAQLGSVTAQGTKQAEAALGSFATRAQQVAGVMGQAGVNTGVFGSAISALTGPLGLATGAIVGLGLAIQQTTSFMRDNYEQLRQLQAVSGLTVDDADALADTFDLLGFNSQALSGAMFKMASSIEDGGKKLRELGVSVRDASGALREPGEVFLEVRDKISKLGTASERNAVIMQQFGRAGREIAAVFSLSDEEFKKFLATASKMGPSASESVRVTEQYVRAQAELNKTIQGFVESAGIKLLPILTDTSRSILQIVKDIDALIEKIDSLKNKVSAPFEFLQRMFAAMSRQTQDALGFSQLEGLGSGGWEPVDVNAIVVKGSGKAAATEIASVTAELEKMKQTLEVMRASPLDQPIVKLEQAFRKFAEEAGPAATKQARAFTDEMIALERAKQAETAVKSLNATMGALAQTMATFARTGGIAASLFPPTEGEQKMQALKTAIEQARAKLVEMKDQLSPADFAARLKVFDDGSQKILEFGENILKMGDATVQAKEEAEAFYKNLAENTETAAKRIESLEFSHTKWLLSINANGELDEANEFYKNLAENIASGAKSVEAIKDPMDNAARSSLAFQQSLAVINAEAALFGDKFDRVGETISAIERRLRELATTAGGVVTEEMKSLNAELTKLTEFKETEALLGDMFGSVTAGLGKFIEGLQLGTRTWKDFGTTAIDVLKSIAAEILNRLIKAALDPLIAKLASAGAAALTGVNPATAGSVRNDFVSSPGTFASDTQTFASGANTFASGAQSFASGANTLVSGISIGTGSSFGTIAAATTHGWSAGAAGFAGTGGFTGGVSGAAQGFWSGLNTAAGAASGLTVALAGVGAALTAFQSVMDIVNEDLEAGIGGLVGGAVGAAGGAVLGSFLGAPWLGGFLGYIAGDLLGSWIGGMFGGPSEGDIKRAQAADEANKALGNLTASFEAAARSGSMQQVLSALQLGAGGASANSVRTELVLPSSLAQAIGVSGQQIGDEIVTQWSALTLEQFEKVIAAIREQPGLADKIRGSGDVPYLEGADAAQIAEQIRQGAIALLNAFVAMQKVRDQITQVSDTITEAATSLLPPDLADKIGAQVAHIRDRMVAVLGSGLPVEEMQAQMEALAAEMDAFAGLVTLYSAVEQDIARLSGDMATQTEGAILAIRSSLDAATRAVELAQERASDAVSVQEAVTANNALRTAILARYELELRLVSEIQAAIQNLLANVLTPMQRMLNNLAVRELRATPTHAPDTAAYEALYHSLLKIAQTAPTVAERLYGVVLGLELVISAAETIASYHVTGSSVVRPQGGGQTIPEEIWNTIAQQSIPFIQEMTDLIVAALASNDIGGAITLLQQQAQQYVAVAQAGIDAVTAWADAALAALADEAQAKADSINTNWDAEIARIELAGDKRVAFLEGEIATIERVAKARQDAIDLEIEGLEKDQDILRDQQQALDELARASERWLDVAKSVNDFLTQLRLSSAAPINPADQLAMAQANFDKLLGQFHAAPTPELASDVQSAAQDLLTAAQNVYTKPSPEFQALFASVEAALEGVAGVAAGKAGPATGGDIDAQTEALAAKAKDIADRIDLLRKDSANISKLEREALDIQRKLIAEAQDATRTAVKIAEDSRRHDLALVAEWQKAQEEAIRKTAQTQIDNIEKGTANALRDNLKLQAELAAIEKAAQERLLHEIIGDMTIQEFQLRKQKEAADLLRGIFLNTYRLAEGLPELQHGAWETHGGLAMLHPGEMVIPPESAMMLRREGTSVAVKPLPASAYASSASAHVVVTFAAGSIVVSGVSDPERAAELAAQKIERRLRDGDLGQMLVERSR